MVNTYIVDSLVPCTFQKMILRFIDTLDLFWLDKNS